MEISTAVHLAGVPAHSVPVITVSLVRGQVTEPNMVIAENCPNRGMIWLDGAGGDSALAADCQHNRVLSPLFSAAPKAQPQHKPGARRRARRYLLGR